MSGDKPRRRAIVVGINKYKDEKKIPELTGAVNDAEEIYERLKDPDIGNFEIADEHHLIGTYATCDRIRKALSDVFYKTDEPCDLALFYFSGHGFEDEWYGDGYIAPFDMLKEDPFVCGIKMSELRQIISKFVKSSPNKCAIAILDCCYSGIAVSKGESDVGTKYEEHVKDFEEEAKEGIIVLASSGEDEKSREVTSLRHENEQEAHPHGAFSFYLIEGLNGQASADESGEITLNRLKNYVNEQMKALKKQKCKSHVSGDSEIGDIVIARSPKKFWDNIQKKIEEARENCDSPILSSLVKATKSISYVLVRQSDNEDAKKIKGKIDEALPQCQELMRDCLTSNQEEIEPRIPAEFGPLLKLVGRLTFDEIPLFNQNEVKWLLALNNFRMGAYTQEVFIREIKKYSASLSTGALNRPSAPPSAAAKVSSADIA